MNHMFWCAASTVDDNEDLKGAKWLSIANHIMNKHPGHENPLFAQCLHGTCRLNGKERKQKRLKPGMLIFKYNYYLQEMIQLLLGANVED